MDLLQFQLSGLIEQVGSMTKEKNWKEMYEWHAKEYANKEG